ncbi:glycosyltransferase [Shewanella sp.]|uniref:glycosyltransferase n=1 Tax=Shewanella sp. TaxID=50422 RepID=UPI004048769D
MRLIVACGTGSFDQLFEGLMGIKDQLDEVFSGYLFQIGSGSFQTCCDDVLVFKFITNFWENVSKDDVVVCHCGAGFVFESAEREQKCLVVVNQYRHDDHQLDLASYIADKQPDSLCFSISQLKARLLRGEIHPLTIEDDNSFNTQVFSQAIGKISREIWIEGYGIGNILMKIFDVEPGCHLKIRRELAERSPNSRDTTFDTEKNIVALCLNLDISVEFSGIRFSRSSLTKTIARKLFRKDLNYGNFRFPPKYILKKLTQRVAIHFRCGDFENQDDREKYKILDDEYYTKALKYMNSCLSNSTDIEFFVISDSHKNQRLPKILRRFKSFRRNSDFEEWSFLRDSAFIITANSTFSASAALVGWGKKIIVMPEMNQRFIGEENFGVNYV